MIRHVTLGTFNPSAYAKMLVNRVLDTGRISYGPLSREFEAKFAELHGCEYAVLSNSGTSSLLVALQTLKELHGWPDGSEVIVPAVTFVATVNAVLQARLKPVLVDVEPDYYGIDVPGVIRAITDQTRAIVPVHLFGQPCSMHDLILLLGLNNTPLSIVEDSCEAMFVSHSSQTVGSWGDIACFSTYVAHLITTGVGGLATTNNPDYARKMRSLVNHGLAYDDLSATEEFDPAMIARRFTFDSIGHSFRITELEAALGLAELEDWQTMITRRQAHAGYLTARLNGVGLYERLQLPKVRPQTQHAWMMYPLVCRQEGIRDKLMAHLAEKGIESRTMLPLTNQPVYRGLFVEDDYPVAKWINANGLYLGVHQGLEQADMDYVVEILRGFFENV